MPSEKATGSVQEEDEGACFRLLLLVPLILLVVLMLVQLRLRRW